MDESVLDLFAKAREAKISVTREVIRSFGRSAKATLLATASTSAAVREKLEDFMAGDKWAKNFVKRNGLRSQRLYGEAGSVNPELIKKDIDEIKALCATFRIFNVDETGIQWKVVPRRTYLTNSENRKTVRGSKGVTYKNLLSAIMCCNADGTAKVDLAIIGKAKEPRCLRGVEAAGEEAMDTIRVWETVEDEDDVAEAMRGDAAEEITAPLAGTHVDADSEEEKEEEEDDDDESTEPERGAPRAYAELSPHFGVPERAAEKCGNKDAAFYLSKSRMSIIAAHSAKRTRQTDLLKRSEEGGNWEGCKSKSLFFCYFFFLAFGPYHLCPA